MPVRRARPDELAGLSTLQTYLAEPSPDLLAAAETVGTVFVSTAGGAPVGYLLAAESAAACHVAEVVVHPDYRREGRARALLGAVFDAQSAGTRVTVTVAADDEAARSLYESVGFEETGRRPAFFESGDAAVYGRTVE